MAVRESSEHSAVSEAETPAPVASLTRRAALGKVRYIAPAIVALEVVRPEVALGRSGPVHKRKPRVKHVAPGRSKVTRTRRPKGK